MRQNSAPKMGLFLGVFLLTSCVTDEAVHPIDPTPTTVKPLPKRSKLATDTESPAEKAKRLELLKTGNPTSCPAVAPSQTLRNPQPAAPKQIRKPPVVAQNMVSCWPKPTTHRKLNKHKTSHSTGTDVKKKATSRSAIKPSVSAQKNKDLHHAKPSKKSSRDFHPQEKPKKMIKSNL